MLLVKSIITKETVSSHSGVYVGTTKGGRGGGERPKKNMMGVTYVALASPHSAPNE